MYTLCWAAKGGSGATVVACTLALVSARERPTILIDLDGDVHAALGLAAPDGPGVGDWLAAPHAPPASLFMLAEPTVGDLQVIGRGTWAGPIASESWTRLAEACATWSSSDVVIDAGTAPAHSAADLAGDGPSGSGAHAVEALFSRASRSLLVVRPCYLGLRRATGAAAMATGVVIVDEPGRALRSTDVERALGQPVVAEVTWDPAIARAVDAGLLATRLPRALVQQMRHAA